MAALPFKLRYAAHLGIRSVNEPLFKATLSTCDPVAHISYAAAQGFAGIEDNFLKDRPIEQQLLMGEALARHGMEMGCFASSFDLTRSAWGMTDTGAREHIVTEIAAAIETAKRVNGRYIVIAASRDLRVPLAYQHTAMVSHLRRVAPIAEKAGVILCLEQTSEYRVPGMLLHHIGDAYAVVKAAESPAVKLLFDFYHVQMMDGNILDHLDRAWNDVAIIQIADVPGRSDIGVGEVNWITVLRDLRRRKYGGLVGYEVFPSSAGSEGEQAAVDALRRVDAAL
jgi:hydroxypyruvate isomerase